LDKKGENTEFSPFDKTLRNSGSDWQNGKVILNRHS
jgi:hypothetical protein